MPFEPGQSGNPSGRPKLDPDIKRLRGLTRDQFKDLANIILTGTQEDLQRLLDQPETSMLTQWICRVALSGAERGDYRTLDELLNRLIGKVKDEVDVNLIRPYVVRSHDRSEEIQMGVTKDEADE